MDSACISMTLMAMRTSLTLLLPCASLAAQARHHEHMDMHTSMTVAQAFRGGPLTQCVVV